MSAPAKYARTGFRTRKRLHREDAGMGQRGDQFYHRIEGALPPIAGDSLIALEAKLAEIEKEKEAKLAKIYAALHPTP